MVIFDVHFRIKTSVCAYCSGCAGVMGNNRADRLANRYKAGFCVWADLKCWGAWDNVISGSFAFSPGGARQQSRACFSLLNVYNVCYLEAVESLLAFRIFICVFIFSQGRLMFCPNRICALAWFASEHIDISENNKATLICCYTLISYVGTIFICDWLLT